MPNYIVRDVPQEIFDRFRARVLRDNEPGMRPVLIALMDDYGAGRVSPKRSQVAVSSEWIPGPLPTSEGDAVVTRRAGLPEVYWVWGVIRNGQQHPDVLPAAPIRDMQQATARAYSMALQSNGRAYFQDDEKNAWKPIADALE